MLIAENSHDFCERRNKVFIDLLRESKEGKCTLCTSENDLPLVGWKTRCSGQVPATGKVSQKAHYVTALDVVQFLWH